MANTGHCSPKVVEAAREQAGEFIHAQANIVYHQPMIRLVEELLTVAPEGLDTLFFSNSRAEAVEASLKLARQATGRTNLIVFQGSFHGRTVGTATEFTTPDGEPDKATTKAMQASCLENKLMLLTCGPYDNIIRWIPPLIVTEEQIEMHWGSSRERCRAP